jgi:hypothetical protein
MGRDAIDTPLKTGGKELHTGDMKISQRKEIDMDDSPLLRTGESLEAVDIPMDQNYLEALAFAEEPIIINIQRSSAKNPATCVPCWVNGKGAEIYKDGKWWVLGFLPVGVPIVTRRKYVEAIIRAKFDSVETQHVDAQEAETDYIDNTVRVNTSAIYPLSVIRDNNPKGADWLTKMMAEY